MIDRNLVRVHFLVAVSQVMQAEPGLKIEYRFTVMWVALFFSLALGETVLRLFFPLPPQNQVEKVEVLDIDGLKPQIVYAVNPWGFRSLSMHSREKPGRTVRILCLGASTTQQYMQDTEDMWCSLLGNSLNRYLEDTGFNVETAAFGRGGMRASDNLRWLVKEQSAFDPDIIITLLGINDLSWNGGAEYNYRGKASLIASIQKGSGKDGEGRQEGSSQLSKLKKFCINNSAICAYLKRAKVRIKHIIKTKRDLESGKATEWHSKRLPGLREKRQGLPYVEDLSRHPDPIVEFRDATAMLHQLAGEYGSDLLALGQPVLWHDGMESSEESLLWFSVSTKEGPVRPGGQWLENEMARYNRVQLDLAAQNGFQYIDLDKVIPKTADVFIDDCHLTLHGSRLIANAVLPTLKKMVLTRIENKLQSRNEDEQ